MAPKLAPGPVANRKASNASDGGDLLKGEDHTQERRVTQLDDNSILRSIKERFAVAQIYSFVNRMLIALNPYEDLGIYSALHLAEYARLGTDDAPSPHAYAVAAAAYKGLVQGGSQSIVITGDSGAGKTETSKRMMQFLAHVAGAHVGAEGEAGAANGTHASRHSRNSRNSRHSGSSLNGNGTWGPPAGSAAALHVRLLRANVLLEAFGNARTTINDNSSRFGKFVQVQYDASARLLGAHVHVYLLEKARVSARAATGGECTFHILYLLVCGLAPGDAQQLGLAQDVEAHRFTALGEAHRGVEVAALAFGAVGGASGGGLGGGAVGEEQGKGGLVAQWGRKLDAVRSELRAVGLSAVDIAGLLRVCAAVVRCGNIAYVDTYASGAAAGAKAKGAAGEEPSAAIAPGGASERALADTARLLGVGAEGLESALASRCIRTGKEWYVKRRSAAEASALRDALARTLYAKVFESVVAATNESVGLAAHSGEAAVDLEAGFIGILDIFGFEILEHNSLEQLLINYTNERLQGLFSQIVFQAARAEAAAEGIASHDFDQPAVDSSATLALLAAPHSGLIDLLNEECSFPGGTDSSFLLKFTTTNKGSAKLVSKANQPRKAAEGFVVAHYAGEVRYEVGTWLEKNRDPFSADVAALLRDSTEPTVARLFALAPQSRIEAARGAGKGAPGAGGVGGQRLVFKGSAKQFDSQLTQLMRALAASDVHFVRAVRPNNAKQPRHFDDKLVMAQLRCAGVFEAVRVFAAGYPDRIPLRAFFFRMRCLVPQAELEAAAAALGPPASPRAGGSSGVLDAFSPRAASDEDGGGGGMSSAQLGRDGRALLSLLGLASTKYAMGRTKVFFKSGVLPALERKRDRLLAETCVKVQAAVRGMLARLRYIPMLEEAREQRELERQAAESAALLALAEEQAEAERQAEAAAAAARAEATRAEATRAAAALAESHAQSRQAEEANAAGLIEAKKKIAELQASLGVGQRGAGAGDPNAELADALRRAASAEAEAAELRAQLAQLRDGLDAQRAAMDAATAEARAAAASWEAEAAAEGAERKRAQALREAERKAAEDHARDLEAQLEHWRSEALLGAMGDEGGSHAGSRAGSRAISRAGSRAISRANSRIGSRAPTARSKRPSAGAASVGGGPASMVASAALALGDMLRLSVGAGGASDTGRSANGGASAGGAKPRAGAFHARAGQANGGGEAAAQSAASGNLSSRGTFAAGAPIARLSRSSSNVSTINLHREINPALRKHWAPTPFAAMNVQPPPAGGSWGLKATPAKRVSNASGAKPPGAQPVSFGPASGGGGGAGGAASGNARLSIADASPDAELLAYAEYMGIDPQTESALMWIAESLRTAPLPAGWQQQRDPAGNFYFQDETTGESSLKHPLDVQFKALLAEHRLETAVKGGTKGAGRLVAAGGGAEGGAVRLTAIDSFGSGALSATETLLLTPGPDNSVRNLLAVPSHAHGQMGAAGGDGVSLLPTYYLSAVLSPEGAAEAELMPLLRAGYVQQRGSLLFELSAEVDEGADMGCVVATTACLRSTLYMPPRAGDVLERELSAVLITELGYGAVDLEVVIPPPAPDGVAVGVDVRRRGDALLAAHERRANDLIVLTGRITATSRAVHVKLSLPTVSGSKKGGNFHAKGPRSLPNLVMHLRQAAGGPMELTYRDRVSPMQAMHVGLALSKWWSVRHAARLSGTAGL